MTNRGAGPQPCHFMSGSYDAPRRRRGGVTSSTSYCSLSSKYRERLFPPPRKHILLVVELARLSPRALPGAQFQPFLGKRRKRGIHVHQRVRSPSRSSRDISTYIMLRVRYSHQSHPYASILRLALNQHPPRAPCPRPTSPGPFTLPFHSPPHPLPPPPPSVRPQGLDRALGGQ